MIRKLTLALLAASATATLFSTEASAAVTCSYDSATKAVGIEVSAGTTFVRILRVGDEITFDTDGSPGGETGCANGPATVANTDLIAVEETASVQSTAVRLDFVNGRLGPGFTDEGPGSEIEILFDAEPAGSDSFHLHAPAETDAQSFVFGAIGGGISGNLNADDDADDIALTDINGIVVQPGTGDDVVSANGGNAFDGPIAGELAVFGSAGDDTLTAGNGSANLTGGLDDDTITGGPGADSAHIEEGNDFFDGGGGEDFASYENFSTAAGVVIDLNNAEPQNTDGAGIDEVQNAEHVVGSNGPDRITGTAQRNVLYGGNLTNDAGADVLIGRGGDDDLFARAGDDVIAPGTGDDNIFGEPGNDTVTYADATAAVAFSLDFAQTGVGQVTGGAGTDTLRDSNHPSDPDANHEIENLVGSPFGGDTLTGNALANEITSYGDGLDDTVNCVGSGDGDTAILDESTVELVSNCETSDYAPQTTVDAGPADGATVADATPSYGLLTDEPATFEVSVDGGAFTACDSLCTTPALTDGDHTLAFRAVDADEHENPDPTPAIRTVTVDAGTDPVDPPADTTAPQTTLDKVKKRTTKRRVRLSFSADESGSTFECSLDGKAFSPCSSPLRTKKLRPGKHDFAVRATDAAGNTDATPASAKFRVVKRKRR